MVGENRRCEIKTVIDLKGTERTDGMDREHGGQQERQGPHPSKQKRRCSLPSLFFYSNMHDLNVYGHGSPGACTPRWL